jgi:hypothetical protein
MSYNKIELHSLLNLIVDKVCGQRHAPAALPKERGPGTRWTEGRVGPRTCLEWCGRKKVSWSTGFQTRTVQPAPPTLSTGPILTLEDGTNRLFRNVGTELSLQKSTGLICFAAEAWNLTKLTDFLSTLSDGLDSQIFGIRIPANADVLLFSTRSGPVLGPIQSTNVYDSHFRGEKSGTGIKLSSYLCPVTRSRMRTAKCTPPPLPSHVFMEWINHGEFRFLFSKGKGKDKVHPITGHEGPEGEKRYSSTLSLTTALDGVGGQRHAPTVLSPGKIRYPLYRRLGGLQSRSGRVRKISPLPGFNHRTVQAVASRYTDCTIPAPPLLFSTVFKFNVLFSKYERASVQLVNRCLRWRHEFNPMAVHMGLVVPPLTLEHSFLRACKCTLLLLIIALILHSHLSLIRRINAEFFRTGSPIITQSCPTKKVKKVFLEGRSNTHSQLLCACTIFHASNKISHSSDETR